MYIWNPLIDAAFHYSFQLYRGEIIPQCLRSKDPERAGNGIKRSDGLILYQDLEIGAIEVKNSEKNKTDFPKMALLLRDMLAHLCQTMQCSSNFRHVKVVGFVCTGMFPSLIA